MGEARRPAPARARPQRVALFTTFYHPDIVGIAPYATEVAEHLAGRGHEVHVVTPFAHYPAWRTGPTHPRRRLTEHESSGVTVHRAPIYVPPSQTAAHRIRYELSTFRRATTARLPKPDVVLAFVPNLGPGLAAARLARRSGARLVIDVQDLTGRAAGQSGVRGGATVGGIASALELALLRRADAVALVSPGFRAHLLEAGLDEHDVAVVRNWSHEARPEAGREDVRARHGWAPDEFVVVHGGTIGNKQALHELDALFDLTRRHLPAVRFHFFGRGSGLERFRAVADAHPHVRLVEPAPATAYAEALSAADVGLVKERVSVLDMSLPSKLTGYFAAGLPTLGIVNPDGVTATELTLAVAGLVAHPHDPASAVAQLRRLADAGTRRDLAANAQDFARAHLDRQTNLAALCALVEGSAPAELGAGPTSAGPADVQMSRWG